MQQERVSQGQSLDVLMVDVGPVGLTLACELLKRGVVCRLVDQTDGPFTFVRAHGIKPRTITLF